MDFNYPAGMTIKEALSRRANRLIGWLQERRYFVYAWEESVVKLRELISIIIDVTNGALDGRVPEEDRKEFLVLFQDSRKMLIPEEDEEPWDAYSNTVAHLISSLETYRGFIEDMVV